MVRMDRVPRPMDWADGWSQAGDPHVRKLSRSRQIVTAAFTEETAHSRQTIAAKTRKTRKNSPTSAPFAHLDRVPA